MILTAQELFDNYLRQIDKLIQDNVQSKEQSLIMAEALIVKVKELFLSQNYAENVALLFVEHALQELNEDKPTIH
tara:strand:- start:862 stop:1086 length:225 start_codon:yes stop_codon:yes gene_type:complete